MVVVIVNNVVVVIVKGFDGVVLCMVQKEVVVFEWCIQKLSQQVDQVKWVFVDYDQVDYVGFGEKMKVIVVQELEIEELELCWFEFIEEIG